MAERRMFSKKIIQSAKFIKMPLETQALYMHLCLNADDDGVVEAFLVMRSIGVSDDNLKLLIAKNFIKLLNEDLVSFVLDWREHNLIRADRKIDSIYKDLLIQILPEVPILDAKERADVAKARQNKVKQNDMDDQWTTNRQHRIDKDRLKKVSVEEDSNSSLYKSHSAIQKKFQKPTLEEIKNYIQAKQFLVNAETFFSYYDTNGWMVGKNTMKSWKSAINYWHTQNKSKPKQPQIGSYDYFLQQQQERGEIIDVEV